MHLIHFMSQKHFCCKLNWLKKRSSKFAMQTPIWFMPKRISWFFGRMPRDFLQHNVHLGARVSVFSKIFNGAWPTILLAVWPHRFGKSVWGKRARNHKSTFCIVISALPSFFRAVQSKCFSPTKLLLKN